MAITTTTLEYQSKLLDFNKFSRPNIKIGQIKGIVIHYVGNTGSTAVANRNYFNRLKEQDSSGTKYASSHYVIGLGGEIILCVPETEVAYHAGSANNNYIGIECCHPYASGQFSDATNKALIALCVDICKRYGLDPKEKGVLKRHYDVTGKKCPMYHVNNPQARTRLCNDIVAAYSQKDAFTAACNKLKELGISNSPGYWLKLSKATQSAKYLNEFNEQYLDILVINMAQYLTKKKFSGYGEAVQALNCISDKELWLEKSYLVKHVVALIEKFSKLG